MKKTLTVNLAGTVFHIDEDAYRLLDEYLRNLRFHFKKEEGVDEIINDFENRISELFAEKINSGVQVISIEFVEEVISRMGKPEELAGDDDPTASDPNAGQTTYTRRRLFRDPDNQMLGGVVAGFAAYFGWDVTVLRLIVLVVLICGVGTLIPIYILCWILIPEARTAAEKLSMRGEEVNVDSIGRTVRDGFERVSDGINDYIKSEKPRNFFQKLADVLVAIAGFVLKAFLIIAVIIFLPFLFVLAIVFVTLIIAAIATVVGGSAALISLLPFADWTIVDNSPIIAIATSIAGVLLVGLPLIGIVYSMLRRLFNWKPMATVVKLTLVFLWFIGLIIFIFGMAELHWQWPYLITGFF